MSASRSLCHLFTVAAARLQTTGGDPVMAKALKKAGDWEAILKAESRNGFWQREQKRIDRQRTLFAMIVTSEAKSAFQRAMLQRAYDLLCDGDATACDALCEFLPSIEVDAMLSAWSQDQDAGKPLSKWYESQGVSA